MTQKFGGIHTADKLNVIEKYLNAYTTALSKQSFDLIYFDAFAGTGSVDITKQKDSLFDDAQLQLINDGAEFQNVESIGGFTAGSARRALQVSRPFDRYVFVEKNLTKFEKLKSLKGTHSNISSKIEIRHGDANIELRKFCASTDWLKTRAVVFLDPYGSQVEWETIKNVAETKAIDLWYLFPSFLGVFRQISKSGKMTSEQEQSIIRLLGTDKWKENWISEERAPDLFDQDHVVGKKQVEVDDITRFMIGRMQEVFDGGVLDSWLPLGQNGAHWYSLIFAWANPGEKAKLAAKLASACMDRK